MTYIQELPWRRCAPDPKNLKQKVPGDSIRDLFISWLEVTNNHWKGHLNSPSQKGHQQNCQVYKLSRKKDPKSRRSSKAGNPCDHEAETTTDREGTKGHCGRPRGPHGSCEGCQGLQEKATSFFPWKCVRLVNKTKVPGKSLWPFWDGEFKWPELKGCWWPPTRG